MGKNGCGSIGVSIYPEAGLDSDALLNSADNMMYEVKEKNKRSKK
jgi:GGDEF domain-containing protein